MLSIILTTSDGTMDSSVIDNVLSAVAIVISIISFMLNLYFENRRNNKLVSMRIFQDIYFKYMMDRIPRSKNNISFNNSTNRMDGIREFNKVLYNLRKKSGFYKFTDKKFYDKITKVLIELDEYCSEQLNFVTDAEKFEIFRKKSDEEVSKLYQILNNKLKKG